MTWPEFWKRILRGLSVKDWGFWTVLKKSVIKSFCFLHDDRRQQGTSFEYDATFGKNLNLGLIRGLSRD